MHARSFTPQRPSAANELLSVWDAQYVPSSEAFARYREIVCRIYLPWSPEIDDKAGFQARIETATVGDGSISRHRCSPHLSTRTALDVANSTDECSYLVRILAGHLRCQQSNSLTLASAGDVLLLDSSLPTRVNIEGNFDALVVTIPKSELTRSFKTNYHLCNTLLNEDRTPLGKCLILLAELLSTASAEELSALYHAVCSLLPVEAGYFDCDKRSTVRGGNVNYLLRGILGHIDQNIANTDLTPHQVADQFGISVRYVHKLFIGCGMTFRTYATARRLDYVCKDLVSPASREQPISLVAFRWGFNDLSSFNRAFKSRYGCTPSQYRMRAVP